MDDKLRQKIEAKVAEYDHAAQELLMKSNMNYAAAHALRELLEETDGEAGEIPPADESEVIQDEG